MKADAHDPETRKRSGISLQRFAAAKKNRYDKKAKLEKTAALNAKRVNKYRKLKAKLEVEGQLKPFLPKHSQVTSFYHVEHWCSVVTSCQNTLSCLVILSGVLKILENFADVCIGKQVTALLLLSLQTLQQQWLIKLLLCSQDREEDFETRRARSR
jgi:hypothetical protein